MSKASANVFSAAEILLVDDTAANLKLLTDILSRAGYRIRPANTGELALRGAQAKPPALVLLDIKMPNMDGFEVCRRLKENELTRDIPVIFLTGVTDTADKSHAFELGAIDYITKPFHGEEVLARVRLHLSLVETRAKLARRNLELQHANEQLEGIYRSVGNGIISVDESQRVVLFNAAAERMFGHAAADMIGQPLSALIPQRFRQQHEMHLRRFGAGEHSARAMGTYGSIYALRANGEEFPIEATVSQSGIAPNKLFTVILNNITERRLSEQERERLVTQLELLSERLAMAQEEEHSRIAYELNEELAQGLMALKIYLQVLDPGGATPAQSSRAQALAVATHATQRIRDLVLNLNPRELDDFGLHAAIQSYCERQAAAAGWNMHIDAPKPDTRAPRALERAGFRILREALGNVLHHAKAREVWVDCHQRADELDLRIRDDGIGFDRDINRDRSGREHDGIGIFGMQIRAKQLGGHVEIKSAVGAGTEVRAVFSLPVAA